MQRLKLTFYFMTGRTSAVCRQKFFVRESTSCCLIMHVISVFGILYDAVYEQFRCKMQLLCDGQVSAASAMSRNTVTYLLKDLHHRLRWSSRHLEFSWCWSRRLHWSDIVTHRFTFGARWRVVTLQQRIYAVYQSKVNEIEEVKHVEVWQSIINPIAFE